MKYIMKVLCPILILSLILYSQYATSWAQDIPQDKGIKITKIEPEIRSKTIPEKRTVNDSSENSGKKWLWILLGIVVVAGGAAAIASSGGDDSSSSEPVGETGSISGSW